MIYYIFLSISGLVWLGCVIGMIGAIIRQATNNKDGFEKQTIMGCFLFGLLAGFAFLVILEYSPILN